MTTKVTPLSPVAQASEVCEVESLQPPEIVTGGLLGMSTAPWGRRVSKMTSRRCFSRKMRLASNS